MSHTSSSRVSESNFDLKVPYVLLQGNLIQLDFFGFFFTNYYYFLDKQNYLETRKKDLRSYKLK